MWIIEATGEVIKSPRSVEINGAQHQANIFRMWSKAELASIGIKPYSEVRNDPKYYNDGLGSTEEVNGEVTKTFVKVDKELDGLKDQFKSEAESVARSILAQSDWRIVEQVETGVPADAAWLTYRAAVRTARDTLMADLDAAADADGVKAVMDAFSWPVSPDAPQDV